MPDAPGERLRSRILQPLVDTAFAHLRVNCFSLASWVLALDAALTMACLAHGVAVHAADAADVLLLAVLVASAASGSTHLRGFGRRRHAGGTRVVHPVFRPAYVFFFTMSWIYPILASPRYLGPAAPFPACLGPGWMATGDVAFELFALGFMIAGCEWRRIPPATRRGPAGHGRLAPSPA